MVCLDETSKQRIKETRVPIPAKPGRPARHDYEYERVDRRAVPAPMGTANIFIQRLWRSLKYEEVFTKAYGSVFGARRGIGGWLSFYDDERPHQAPGYRTPRADFACEACDRWITPAHRYALLRRYPHAHRHNIKKEKKY